MTFVNEIERIGVQVGISKVTTDGVFLSVSRYSDDFVVSQDIDFDQFMDHNEWIVGGVMHPPRALVLREQITNPRQAFDNLKALTNERNSRRYEEASCCDRVRYEALKVIVADLDRKLTVARMVAQVTILNITGMWPHELDGLNL